MNGFRRTANTAAKDQLIVLVVSLARVTSHIYTSICKSGKN